MLAYVEKFNLSKKNKNVAGKTPRKVYHFWICERFSKLFRKINKWILNSLETEMFESKNNCLALRRLTLCGV